MNNHDVNIGTALLKFKFRDEDGEVISSFRINPADVKLAKRCRGMIYSEQKDT